MQVRDFVLALREERDAMLASYIAPEPSTEVGTLLQQAGLTDAQRESVIAALDAALTDAFYTILLGLDGAASLGGTQQCYRLQDEAGAVISDGNGELEAAAFELLQER
jgi:hypothetical protein